MDTKNFMAQFEEAFTRFETLILSLTDDIFLSPMNAWSPRDVVAHLIGWNRITIDGCEDIKEGRPPFYHDDAGDGYVNINAQFITRYSSQDKELLLAELRTTMAELNLYLKSLDPIEWEADYGVQYHRGGAASIARTVAGTAQDYQGHLGEIEEWIRTSSAG